MELVARQVKITKISTAHVPLVMLGGFVTKTSTSVNFHHHHAEMELHAKTRTVPISACAQKDMKEETAPSTRMIALLSHVRMAELVLMASATTLACVTKVLKENTVRWTSMSAYLNLASTEQLALNM